MPLRDCRSCFEKTSRNFVLYIKNKLNIDYNKEKLSMNERSGYSKERVSKSVILTTTEYWNVINTDQ